MRRNKNPGFPGFFICIKQPFHLQQKTGLNIKKGLTNILITFKYIITK